MNINNVLEMFIQNYLKFLSWLFPVTEQHCDAFPPVNHLYSTPFQKLILDYLSWNGIDKKGNVTSSKVYPTRIEILEAKRVLRKYGFSTDEYLEKLIVSEFLEMKRNIPNLTSVMFANFFEENYHNINLSNLQL